MDLTDASSSSSSSPSSSSSSSSSSSLAASSVATTPPPEGSSRPPSRPKSVSRRNEELLSAQNAALAEEYLHGAWAHESAVPEVGGLVCRMPLEAEIYRGSSSSSSSSSSSGGGGLGARLRSFLDSEEYGGADDASIPPTSLRSSASTGGASASSSMTSVGRAAAAAVDGAVSAGDPVPGDDDADPASFSAIAARTVFWYRGAERLLRRELVKIMSNARPDGRIDPSALGPESVELLRRYMDHQNTWQEVCLVIEHDERTGRSKTVTINRPMAFKLSRNLGTLVLLGSYKSEGGGAGSGKVILPEGNVSGIETQNLVKFLSAFENQCGVYLGGPDDMDKPAMIIHGIRELPGAVEISPGTGIFYGGLEAAMDGVLSGKYKPLDFRFFIGHTSYIGGRLDEAVRSGKYQPVACSRPLVLKQCIQLPKPLWHEVLEFCGGELKEISRLEFTKRSDLR
ncbi:hypothetical protein ACHAW5_000301 [Stephanodiscus triporus]|uniref:Uncharacterized protein n=1 Tax=Stephanodiscus triporus TaxID=2934178 RepID=A0ABD3MW18_9STRA